VQGEAAQAGSTRIPHQDNVDSADGSLDRRPCLPRLNPPGLKGLRAHRVAGAARAQNDRPRGVIYNADVEVVLGRVWMKAAAGKRTGSENADRTTDREPQPLRNPN
jgi:hypothetical protein